jgi:hypothetical protein
MIGKQWKHILIGLALMGLAMQAQAFSLQPSDDPVVEGAPVTFALNGDYTDLLSFQVDIAFDPDRLALTDAQPNPGFPGAGDPLSTLLVTDPSQPGAATLFFSGSGPASATDGLILSLLFQTLAVGDAGVSVSGFYEQDLTEVLVPLEAAGQVAIAAPPHPAPEGSSLVTLLVGLGALTLAVGRMRRRPLA